jgi:hypothetical protein
MKTIAPKTVTIKLETAALEIAAPQAPSLPSTGQRPHDGLAKELYGGSLDS